MNYLVVDPSPTMRRILVNALLDKGKNTIFEASDGVEALEKLNTRRIDIVFTEWDMPEMDGIKLISKIRNDEMYKDMPVIMITSRGSRKDVVEALKARCDTFIVKPFNKMVLRRKLLELIEIKGLNKVTENDSEEQ